MFNLEILLTNAFILKKKNIQHKNKFKNMNWFNGEFGFLLSGKCLWMIPDDELDAVKWLDCAFIQKNPSPQRTYRKSRRFVFVTIHFPFFFASLVPRCFKSICVSMCFNVSPSKNTQMRVMYTKRFCYWRFWSIVRLSVGWCAHMHVLVGWCACVSVCLDCFALFT